MGRCLAVEGKACTRTQTADFALGRLATPLRVLALLVVNASPASPRDKRQVSPVPANETHAVSVSRFSRLSVIHVDGASGTMSRGLIRQYGWDAKLTDLLAALTVDCPKRASAVSLTGARRFGL